ncbi:MAG TPA: hypothetical protein V6C65_01920 [Allocoleopsis sp.]
MSNTPIEIPDQISTLELSQLWLYKALQRLERELRAGEAPEEATEDLEDEELSNE